MGLEDIITAIDQSRRERRARGPFTSEGTLSIDEAYEVQCARVRALEEAGDPVVGYKIGLISPAKQQQMGVNEPILGHLHRSMLVGPGEAVHRSRFVQPRVEPELAVVFNTDLSEAARAADLLPAVDYVFLSVDVLDSIYAGYRFTAADVIADNASGGAVILGSRPLPVDTLWDRNGVIRLSVDGGPWQSGTLGDIGDPLALIAWAVERAARLGRGIRGGDLLLLGAPCAAVGLEGASAVVAEGPGDGEQRSRLVAAVR